MIGLITLALAAVVQDANPPAAPAPEKKICRTTQASGTRLGSRRVCQTEKEYRAAQQELQRDMYRRQDAMTQNAGVTPPE